MHRVAAPALAPQWPVAVFGHLTYIIFELGWALPVLAAHWLLGFRRLRARWRLLLLVAIGATVYLSLADSVAIHAGIWTLHPSRILGLRLGNVPIEESVFFLVTNLMVVQSLVLLSAGDTAESTRLPRHQPAPKQRRLPASGPRSSN